MTLLSLFASAPIANSTKAEDPLPSLEKVRCLLTPGDGPGFLVGDDGKRIGDDPLLKFGDRLFPVYETLISDPKSDPAVVTNAFYAICAIKVDRKRFLNLTVESLVHSSPSVRESALELLRDIGNERDTAPVVLLLSDDHYNVRRGAVKALAKIGGKRDVVAMDIWLKTGNHRNDGDHVRLVKKCRDELEKRLKDNPIPKDLKN